jgi:tetratricopeptide (TPR) repeat protein
VLSPLSKQLLCLILVARGAGAAANELSRIAARFGGRVHPLAGGACVVVLAGDPAATDQAVRGARCALAIHKARRELSMALAMGLGQAGSGPPVGEVIDRAARLLRAHRLSDATVTSGPARPAARAPILVDAATAELLDERFVVSDAAELEAPRVLTSEREHATTLRPLLGRSTPFVGRERELGRLSDAWRACREEARARAIVITAPAGLGKSRLLRELLPHLDGATIWTGRGDPMSAGAPFGLLGQMIRSACDIVESDDPTARRKKLAAKIGGRGDVERIGELAGLGDRPRALDGERLVADQLLQAWQDWLTADARDRPLVLMLEDLHWSDAATVRYVEAALHALADRALYVVATARPEVDATFPELWAAHRTERIRLGELAAGASEELVRHVLGASIDPTGAAELARRSAGNALFLEEVIRRVAAGRKDELPETVFATVHARLEGLPDTARRVLRAASVFGQSFPAAGVSALLGIAAGELGEAVAELLQGELLVPEGDHDLQFRHELVRDAAYQMLTEPDRVLGHRLAGEWLERAGSSEAAVLAQHLARGGLGHRAIAWYQRAAEQALDGNDFAAAVRFAEQGLTCGATGEGAGELWLLQAQAHRWQGDQRAAETKGREAAAVAPRDSALWHAALRETVWSAGNLGKAEAVSAVADELLDVDLDVTSGIAARTNFALVAASLAMLGQVERARTVIERIDRLGGDVEPLVRGYTCTARLLIADQTGDVEGMLDHGDAATRAYEAAGDQRGVCLGLCGLGAAYAAIGDFARSRDVSEGSIRVAERLRLRHEGAIAKANLGLAHGRAGAYDASRTAFDDALVVLRGEGDRRNIGWTLAAHALMLVDAARERPASSALAEADDAARAAAEALAELPALQAYALAAQAAVAMAAGRAAEALEHTVKAYGSNETLGTDAAALIGLYHARALDALGRRAQARTAIARAHQALAERAERIRSPERRETFLAIAEHAETLTLARAWGEVS